MRKIVLALFTLTLLVPTARAAGRPDDGGGGEPGLLLRGAVVTMDEAGTVLKHGNVLIRGGLIEAVWEGPRAPRGVDPRGATLVDLDRDQAIYPGLINLHDHPLFAAQPIWVPPSTHVQSNAGRPTGTEPYANRYQWNTTVPPEHRRIVTNPSAALTEPFTLNRSAEVVKWAELRGLLGGQTSMQGAPPSPAVDGLLARNVDNTNFGADRVENRVASIANATFLNGLQTGLLKRVRDGATTTFLVHLAEGVRDGDRRAGDPVSSRGEFALAQSVGLVNEATVIIHGTALEAPDFAAMAAAPSIRTDGAADGLGAKLVWSPLSNLLLYGETAEIYEALAAGVSVSLGTDWSPSGSHNLLGELKIADLALRDERILGDSRALVPELADDEALDRALVEMVTINPARALRWDHLLGTVEAGKIADLAVVRSNGRKPDKEPYRTLIDATEAEVDLVLVGGDPVAGAVDLMSTLKPGDHEVVTSPDGGFQKAVDATKAGVPKGDQTVATIESVLRDGLEALAGDNPPPGGGPAPLTNTYSYLKANVPGGSGLTDAQFNAQLAFIAGTVGGKLNLEAVELSPLFTHDDDWLFAVLEDAVDDAVWPYAPYPANANHVGPVNPLEPVRRTWYEPPGQGQAAA